MTLRDLITRLEQAEGGSRELDAALWGLVDPRPLEQAGEGPAIYKRDPVDTIAFDAPPPFTSSVDSALALIGERLPGFHVENLGEMRDSGTFTGHWLAQLGPRGPRLRLQGAITVESVMATFDGFEPVSAPTPALALCLALCLALHSQEQSYEG